MVKLAISSQRFWPVQKMGQLWLGLAGTFVALVVLLMSAGNGQAVTDNLGEKTAQVTTQSLHLQEGFAMPVPVYGLVESPQRTDIAFERSGLLASMNVEEGDEVTAGQPLATLDLARLNAREAELQATLARAEADARLAELTVERLRTLTAQQVESAQRLDEAKARLAASNAQLAEVAAALESLQVERNKSRLEAPFAGTITARYVDRGTVVDAGTPVVRLSSREALQVRFALPADTALAATPGTTLRVKVNESVVDATVTQRLATRARATRTIDILVALPADAGAMPGDMVSMLATTERSERGAWVPVSALSNGLRGLWRLFVVSQDDQQPLQLEARTVEVIYTDGERAFIRGAVADGDEFVTQGTHRLAPGQSVSVTKRPTPVAGL
ncbi:efflux RND transporter periplasmic adaptor subunit [Alteromonas sp. ASW11-19]|uniref:Efflux RND transporter periplasmic adaptor subunit n=1 Tax=Alteromonas salexigens TaxID=2982530 RepID=A0ABT2VJE0_9ALTE|nr:efflux RND transporter periplasmic adaptor subunit [Alteromonas salexigens]MCU7553336.1 efflux RND transporter periplasmic adaptor subunit [Alteromonas salexigens]